MIQRWKATEVRESLVIFPAVAIIGPRQVGKTTLARALTDTGSVYLDLERPSDIDRLTNPEYFLGLHRKQLVIIDEIQCMPELFPLLRYEIDAERRPGRFLLLGSSGPELMRQTSESLAGRLKYVRLNPFSVREVPVADWQKLWLRGGFPEAFLSATDETAFAWLSAFESTLTARDLPALGLSLTSLDTSRFVRMLAHHHGSVQNASQLARALGVSQPTIMKGIDFLEQAFLVTRLQPWFTNARKRITKSPKVYIGDTGLLHSLLGIHSHHALLGHPVAGHSFERFAMVQVMEYLPGACQCYFYRTQDGTECDLVIVKDMRVKACIEIKLGANPKITRSLTQVMKDLRPEHTYIITPLEKGYSASETVSVIGIGEISRIAESLR